MKSSVLSLKLNMLRKQLDKYREESEKLKNELTIKTKELDDKSELLRESLEDKDNLITLLEHLGVENPLTKTTLGIDELNRVRNRVEDLHCKQFETLNNEYKIIKRKYDKMERTVNKVRRISVRLNTTVVPIIVEDETEDEEPLKKNTKRTK